MKLLIITQKVDQNDDILGFFYRWIEEFAKQTKQISVIALEVGEHKNLPDSVTIYGLGKPASRFLYIVRLFKYLFKIDRDYDFVFVHMNPVYLVLAGWWFKFRGKKTVLWYTHRQVDFKLWLAEKFADLIFSAAPESFRLKSKKVQFVGHGIDLKKFACQSQPNEREKIIIHVGRITPIKNCDVLIESFAKLKTKPGFDNFKLIFIGQPATKQDEEYFGGLKKIIRDLKLEETVTFAGSVPNNQLAGWYGRAAVSVNLTPTGGVDKAVLESMACGTPVFVSNEAFKNYFSGLTGRFIFKYRDSEDLANKLQVWFEASDQREVSELLVKVVKDRVEVGEFVTRLVGAMSKLK